MFSGTETDLRELNEHNDRFGGFQPQITISDAPTPPMHAS
jgi:hypothetical protein